MCKPFMRRAAPGRHRPPSSALTLSVVTLAGLLAVGCGGGGDSGPVRTEEPISAPAAPVLTLGYGIKTFRFGWGGVADADEYRLFEDPDGANGPEPEVQISAFLSETSYDYPVALFRRVNASYRLHACNAGGCTASAPVAVSSNLIEAVGYLKAENADAGDLFGAAVALSADGRTLAIGASGENGGSATMDPPDNTRPRSGAVYVYQRGAAVGDWHLQAYVKAASVISDPDRFGYSVALSDDGSTMIVGAPQEDSNASGVNSNLEFNNFMPDSGAAYVFVRSGETWLRHAYLKAAFPAQSAWLGVAVAISGDGKTAVAGAPNNGVGTATVYQRQGASWILARTLVASNADAGDQFGWALAVSKDGKKIVVGAPFEDSDAQGDGGDRFNNLASQSGAVYEFQLDGSIWLETAYIKSFDSRQSVNFGYDLALAADGRTLAVGAPGIAGGGGADLLTLTGTQWKHAKRVPSPQFAIRFGQRLAISADGRTVAVADPYDPSAARGLGGAEAAAGELESGGAWVWELAGSSWQRRSYVKAINTGSVDLFGFSLAMSGDGRLLAIGAVNEDSSARGIGGNPDDAGHTESGAVYLY